MSVFLGIGDLHLSASNGYGGLSRYVDNSDQYILEEVQRVLDTAKADGIEQVFVYGDICDGPRMSYNAHLQLLKLLRRNKDLFFHFILGNHDKLATDSTVGHSLQVLQQFRLKNVAMHLAPEVVDFGDCKINFLSYPFHDFQNMLNVCHLDIKGAVTDNGRKVTKGVDASGYPVVSGHIHSSGDYGSVHYSGTLYQLNFGESADRKGYHIIECSGTDCCVQYVPFKSKIQLLDLKLPGEVPAADPNKFWRLFCTEDVDPAVYAHLQVVQIRHAETAEQLEVQFTDLQLDPVEVLKSIIKDWPAADRKKLLSVRASILARK